MFRRKMLSWIHCEQKKIYAQLIKKLVIKLNDKIKFMLA